MCHHEQKPFCEPVASSAKTASIFGLVVEDFVLEETPLKSLIMWTWDLLKFHLGVYAKVRKYDMPTK